MHAHVLESECLWSTYEVDCLWRCLCCSCIVDHCAVFNSVFKASRGRFVVACCWPFHTLEHPTFLSPLWFYLGISGHTIDLDTYSGKSAEPTQYDVALVRIPYSHLGPTVHPGCFWDTPSQIADQSQPAIGTLHWQAYESCLHCPGTLCVSEVGQVCIQRFVEMKRTRHYQ